VQSLYVLSVLSYMVTKLTVHSGKQRIKLHKPLPVLLESG
jgi:hypothetical protein